MRILISLISLALAVFLCVGWSQMGNDQQPTPQVKTQKIDAKQILKDSEGIVTEISPQEIVIEKEDYTGEEESYTIDPQVKIESTDSLDDIGVGDMVSVKYVTDKDKKIVKVIRVEEFNH
ncbi:MAG: hypothetical protein JXD21_07375 [Candidatus Omnitrophica bacterium]|nr:hypothetical protein [Candidatus Omnitrophota bacterium]